MDNAIATIQPQTAAALAEQVVIKGDLKGLSDEDRMKYYTAVCESLGLNPLTRPFEYLSLNGKLTLYATRAAADQLRSIKGITITSLDPRQIGDLFVVVATGRDRSGREDSSTGAVSVAGLRGEALANAMMKAETKAKRRLTLSLAGLGMTDETEVDSIPGAVRQEPPAALSLAERAAARRAEIDTGPTIVPDAAGGPSPEALQPPPPGIASEDFRAALERAGISIAIAQAKAKELFPNVGRLDDGQRYDLLLALTAPETGFDEEAEIDAALAKV